MKDLQTYFVDLQNLKGLGEMNCDFTREYNTGGVISQVTVLNRHNFSRRDAEAPRKERV